MNSHYLSALFVIKRLQEAGYIAYFAGGWVRDYLMDHPSDDIDIATSAQVSVIQQLFPKTIPVGIAFGILIVVHESYHFEIATFRTDRGYVDGRRPTAVSWATPEEDAKRRDFTINGIFYDPVKEEIHDFVEGLKDIKKGVIRTIGPPQNRFQEDSLRMMRAVRYSTRFRFSIESETFQAILLQADTLLPAVAMERIWQELKKMSRFAHFNTALILLHQLKLLPIIFPSLKDTTIEEIQDRVKSIDRFPKEAPTISEILELFPDSSLEEALKLCDYLKLSTTEKKFVQFYHHAKNLLNLPNEWKQKLEPIEWAYFYADPNASVVLEIIGAHFSLIEREKFLNECSRHRELLEQPILRIQTKNPILRAQHLIKEGIKPGKNMGLLLREGERLSVNQGIDDLNLLIHLLKTSSPHWRSST